MSLPGVKAFYLTTSQSVRLIEIIKAGMNINKEEDKEILERVKYPVTSSLRRDIEAIKSNPHWQERPTLIKELSQLEVLLEKLMSNE
jgi:DNA-binding HxlR family transcriptional regulator